VGTAKAGNDEQGPGGLDQRGLRAGADRLLEGPARVELHARWLARAAKAFDVPIVLSTIGVELGTTSPTHPAILAELEGIEPIDRSSTNSFESEAFRDAFLAIPVLSNPVPLDLYVSAADIYRLGRRKGVTIRSGVDCLIAAIAIRNAIPVWHRDRDFDVIARYTALETV